MGGWVNRRAGWKKLSPTGSRGCYVSVFLAYSVTRLAHQKNAQLSVPCAVQSMGHRHGAPALVTPMRTVCKNFTAVSCRMGRSRTLADQKCEAQPQSNHHNFETRSNHQTLRDPLARGHQAARVRFEIFHCVVCQSRVRQLMLWNRRQSAVPKISGSAS